MSRLGDRKRLDRLYRELERLIDDAVLAEMEEAVERIRRELDEDR